MATCKAERNLLATLVTLAAAAAAGNARGDPGRPSPGRDDLARHGYILVESCPQACWSAEEASVMARVLLTLPAELREVSRRSPSGSIRIHKASDPQDDRQWHSAPALLHWQMTIAIEPSLDREESVEALLARRFVHQLLHVYDSAHGHSRSEAWRGISGWRRFEYLGLEIPYFVRGAFNQDLRAYADPAGLLSPEEDFATFGATYFVTPDSTVEESIACRTPEKFAYFRRMFPGHQPLLAHPGIRCRSAADGFLDDIRFLDPLTRRPLDPGRLTPERIEGFELLYATPGVGDAAEVAGHLLLRIRVRPAEDRPGSPLMGIDRPDDIVVSFLADTDQGANSRPGTSALTECRRSWVENVLGATPQGRDEDALKSITQALKGLSGGFLTTFDRQSLFQAVKSYTIDQDRNLLRYRLELTEVQKSRLFERLYQARNNFRARYYFFDRNCASILVQVIGEGIGDKDVATFDPLVVPPNALVAMLVRRGLATQVFPSFHGYRKKAQIAQEEIRARAETLRVSEPALALPDPADFTARDESRRLSAWRRISATVAGHPTLRDTVRELAILGQDAELLHLDRRQRCAAFATEVTLELRLLLARLGPVPPDSGTGPFDVNSLLHARYAPTEARSAALGSSHTHLEALSLGVGTVASPEESAGPSVLLGLAIHRQDPGSISAQSMQRATGVILGQLDLMLSTDLETAGKVSEFDLTGLKIRKFKERLDQVPSYVSDYGTFGLGLTVLEFHGHPPAHWTRGTLAGGALLFNVASSALFDRYLYLSVGADLDGVWRGMPGDSAPPRWHDARYRLMLPVGTEVLWTVGQNRQWQLRGHGTWRPGIGSQESGYDWRAGVSITRRLLEPGDTELLLRLGGDVRQEWLSGEEALTTWRYLLALDWIRF